MKNPHMMLVAIDPPRKHPARRWRCGFCHVSGLYDDVRAIECSYVYPPCEYCGGTPECTLDCPGIAKALAGEDVYIAGLPPPKGEPS
jgi:hypothetical protein